MVFYFTGTGNSLYVAKNLDSQAFSIPKILNSKQNVFEGERIGIVCPIYGHEMPKMVKEFLLRTTLKTSYLYVILTYGNRHANCVGLCEEFLSSVGKKAEYINTILMVDNFLVSFDMNEQLKIDKNIPDKLEKIKFDISQKRQFLQPVTDEECKIHEKYLEMVKNSDETVWAKFNISDSCIGCGICTRVCPSGSIYLENQKAVHTDVNCQACFACIHACPKTAILMSVGEKNPTARYRNENVSLSEIIEANEHVKEV